MEYQPDRINLSELVDNTVDLLKETAIGKNIQLTNAVAPDISVCADKNMLDTIIRNLTSNALKFTSGGGRVTISARRDRSLSNNQGVAMTKPSPSQSKARTGISFFRSLRGMLILLFLAVSLIPLLTVGVLAYAQAQQALETEATA